MLPYSLISIQKPEWLCKQCKLLLCLNLNKTQIPSYRQERPLFSSLFPLYPSLCILLSSSHLGGFLFLSSTSSLWTLRICSPFAGLFPKTTVRPVLNSWPKAAPLLPPSISLTSPQSFASKHHHFPKSRSFCPLPWRWAVKSQLWFVHSGSL